jgi:hypothetical protein
MENVWDTSFDAWVPRAFPLDSKAVTRWFEITSSTASGTQLLFQRVLGWDDSPLPNWVQEVETEHVRTVVEARDSDWVLKLLEHRARRPHRLSGNEIRRIVAPVSDWYGRTCAETFSLRIPLVVYEVWGTQGDRRTAYEAWSALSPPIRDGSGLNAALAPFLGSTVILLPQRRPYFVDVHNLVVPGVWRDLLVVSEVLDGPTVLSQSAAPFAIIPRPTELPENGTRHMNVYEIGTEFAAANTLTIQKADTVAFIPRDAHGHSGSDWRVTIVGDGICAGVAVGLIRGIGGGYFTTQPWLERSPDLGFSAPARVTHIPPSAGAADAAFQALLRAGGPVAVCDPYAEAKSLARLGEMLRGGKLVTTKKRIDRGEITEAWAKSVGLTVHFSTSLHDRFVIGSLRSFLVGHSLNGLGSKHSFLVELDAVMRLRVQTVFDAIWQRAQPAW